MKDYIIIIIMNIVDIVIALNLQLIFVLAVLYKDVIISWDILAAAAAAVVGVITRNELFRWNDAE